MGATATPAPLPWLDRPLVSRLKLRQLGLIVALTERGSLRQAAADLAMTQPAATKLLRDLESAMGAALFTRHPYGMVATEAGRTLVRYARGVLNELSEARDELKALAQGEQGRLGVGGTTGTMPGLLAPAIRSMQLERPGVKLYVLVNATEVLLDALRQGTLDVAVCTLPVDAVASDLAVVTLGIEPLIVVGRVGHPLARRRRVPPTALMRYPWLVQPPASPLRQDLEAMLANAGLRLPRSAVETVSIVATLALLQQSDAITIMPRALAQHYRAFGMVTELPVDVPSPASRYELVTRAGRELSPAARAFVERVTAQVRGTSGLSPH